MMASATNKVSSVLRIVRGERDALVRTAHFKAANENVSFATIERKIMSTKTSFKRVALVAVASLGIGVLSSMAPASAAMATWSATGNANTSVGINKITLATLTTAPTVGSAVLVSFGTDIAAGETSTGASASVVNRFVGVLSTYPANAARTVTVSGANPGGAFIVTSLTGWTTESATTGNAIHFESATAGNAGAGARESVTASTTTGLARFSFTPDVAGTYVLTVFNQAGDGGSTSQIPDASEASQTISIVVAAASSYTAGTSTSVSAGGVVTGFTGTTDSTTAEKTVSKTVGTIGGTIQVTLKNADASAANGLAVSATISGSGLILTNATIASTAGTGRSSSASAATMAGTNVAFIHVSADGSAGVGTIVISVTDAAGVTSTLATETYTFVGSVTAFTRDADTAKAYIGVGDTDTIDLLPVDSLGNTAADFTTVASSSNTLVATVANGTSQVVVTGVKSGTAVITVCNTVCTATGAISNTFTVKVSKTTAASYTLTFDKATYAPGEKMTLTVSAIDSNGDPVADSGFGHQLPALRTLYSSTGLTANAAITGLPAATTTAALVSGKKAYTMFAPLISGDVVISATQGADVDAVIAGGTGAAVTATATVSGGSADAALDAANEATDAAYAAADAADNATQAAVDAGAAAALAQESADAALAAVTDLGIKVTGLLDKLSASLANIYKIIKAIQAKK